MDMDDQPKAIVKSCTMDEDMQIRAVQSAQQAVLHYSLEKDIAAHIKREFDQKLGFTWHCVVGKNFGSLVTHENNYFIYFYLGPLAVMLWKAG
ncbi:Dynein light chain 1, cytoplasmic [Cichlidogyrus casuarinus]|uniref:Dynein light chain n=1 Tax=Cichlidogyrus casuarinus TaxID=1844966 RepID=A0ABD2PPC4_9PLAT